MHNEVNFKLGYRGNPKSIDAYPRAVFPFVTLLNFDQQKEKTVCQAEGTGFFIHPIGLFVTAKHVPFLYDEPIRTLLAIHSHNDHVSIRHIRRFTYHPNDDIAVGFLDRHDPRNKFVYQDTALNLHLLPNFEYPIHRQMVINFGYGGSHFTETDQRMQTGNFNCQWNSGRVLDIHPKGRDRVMLPGACVHTDMTTIGKASGGPVFDENGFVIGVNSTSFDGDNPSSYFVPIKSILELSIMHDTFGEILVKDLF